MKNRKFIIVINKDYKYLIFMYLYLYRYAIFESKYH